MRRGIALRIWIWSVQIAFALASRLPIRRRVVLATAHTAAIRGNLAAIRDEIERRGLDVPTLTLIHDPRPGLRGQVLAAMRGLYAAYLLATSALFVVDSHYTPIYVIRRRPGTTIVQVWHACGAIKKIGYSVLDKSFGADEGLTDLVRLHTNYSLCLAASQSAVTQYMDAFRQPAELFVTDLGIPGTDVLIRPEGRERLVAAIRTLYAIPSGMRVILYAPTFRGDDMTKARHPEDLDLGLLARTLGADHVLLLRRHPAARRQALAVPGREGFIIDVSDYPEVNELMLVSDVLLTDYSSVAFEFALLERPMAFFAPDADAYERERGFYFDYRATMPGPVFETTDALAAYLRAGSFDLARVESFSKTWFEVADGHASERFVERVVVPALERRRVV
ncbi:MAG TPA: CDP-glycerol glycerophosphotransferase family protein [Candidatus Limnocylindrales bacterium]